MKTKPLYLNLDSEPEIDSDTADMTVGFWKRQFLQPRSRKQELTDWLYGVVIPLACIAFDPIVFKSGSMGGSLLGAYRPFAYLLSAVSILAMAAWLLWGERLKWLCAPLGGLFLAGGAVSLVIGAILFPFSVIGLFFFLIGALGFTPLISGIVFIRNGVRALRASSAHFEARVVWRAATLAVLLSIVIPYLANVYVSAIVYEIANGDAATIRREVPKIRLVSPLASLDPVRRRYWSAGKEEKLEDRFRAMHDAYLNSTGSDLDTEFTFAD